MTELSYLWDGIVVGDASLAPYDKDEFNTYIAGIHTADSDDAFVIPGYADDLEALTTGSMAVSISTGAAVIQHYMYVNTTARSLTLNRPQFYRFDYIALELDVINQTVRLVVIEGNDSSDYTLLENPNLTQTTSLWQSPIARIFLDGTDFSVVKEFIYDERKFAITAYSAGKYDQKNLIKNSEFMCVPGGTTPSIWLWSTTGSLDVQTVGSKAGAMSRGQTISFDGTDVLYHYVPLDGIQEGETFTLHGTFEEITGDASFIEFTIQGLGSLGSSVSVASLPVEQQFIRLEANDVVIFTKTFRVSGIPESGFKGLRLRIGSDGGTSNVGQCILVKGYHAGPLRQITEYIPAHNGPFTDASWTDTAKSTGTTTIDFTADFGAEILPQTKAVQLRLRGRDSGSAAGSPYMRILGYNATYANEYGRLDLEGVTNDVYREITCMSQLRIDVVATGGGTFDATVEVMGIYI
jgi:hypothetical protein